MADEQLDWVDRDDEFADDNESESSADLSLSPEKFSGLIIAPADWTIETLYSLIGRQIDLDPDFQRRNVWNSRAKSRFIESLLLGIPIPQILLSSKINNKSSFIVLDGKQRLLTIKEFIDGKLPNGQKFRLKELRVLRQLEGKTWEQIKEDEEVASKLLNETQRTAVLRGWGDESVLYEIFYRLNSGSVKLSPMELRMSLYPGDFLKYILKWSEKIGPIHQLLKKKTPDPRMGDVELGVRYLAFSDREITYEGDLKSFLDNLCGKYNSKFSDDLFREDLQSRLNNMDEGIRVGINIFGIDRFCRKFNKERYEQRFNRALFDVMSYSLAKPEFREWAANNSELLVNSYKRLSTADNDFIRSIETTTKSIEATKTRFQKWLGLCSEISGLNFEFPAIKADNAQS